MDENLDEDLIWRCVREDGEEKFLGMNFDVSAALTGSDWYKRLPLYRYIWDM